MKIKIEWIDKPPTHAGYWAVHYRSNDKNNFEWRSLLFFNQSHGGNIWAPELLGTFPVESTFYYSTESIDIE